MPTLGDILREAREEKNLTIADLSRSTNIKKVQLEGLENNDYSAFPAPLYTKGFIKLYANQVGLDPEPLVAMFTESLGGPTTASAEPLRKRREKKPKKSKEKKPKKEKRGSRRDARKAAEEARTTRASESVLSEPAVSESVISEPVEEFDSISSSEPTPEPPIAATDPPAPTRTPSIFDDDYDVFAANQIQIGDPDVEPAEAPLQEAAFQAREPRKTPPPLPPTSPPSTQTAPTRVGDLIDDYAPAGDYEPPPPRPTLGERLTALRSHLGLPGWMKRKPRLPRLNGFRLFGKTIPASSIKTAFWSLVGLALLCLIIFGIVSLVDKPPEVSEQVKASTHSLVENPVMYEPPAPYLLPGQRP